MVHRSSKALILSMERCRVSYDFYVAISFQSSSLASLGYTLRELALSPRLRTMKSWIIMIWMIFGMIYALSIPSILTAATGYTLPSQAFWQLPDGTMVSELKNPVHACWLVQDGSRIGLANHSLVSGPSWFSYWASMRNTSGTCLNAAPDYPLFNSISDCKQPYLPELEVPN
jgi:hypothetical protein